MDQAIRLLLIERARMNAPITYATVMQEMELNYEIRAHRDMMKAELAEISTWEHTREIARPMLSSMVKYTGKDQIGPGFYRLAETLGYGNMQDLERTNFERVMQNRCFEYWRNDANYNNYVNDFRDQAAPAILDETTPPFFTKEDIDFFALWVNKVYDKNSAEIVEAKNRIMNTVGAKTVFWAQKLSQRLDRFESYHPRVWQKQGWDDSTGENRQVVKFKHYSWARIYKSGDRNKDIFFTIQADGEEKCLAYKLDYFFEKNSALTESQKELCIQLIPDELKWIPIPASRLAAYSWDRLLDETEQFIRDNEQVYDQIIESVWSGNVQVDALTDRLIKRERPVEGVVELPERVFSFAGHDTDWESQQRQLTEYGNIGEELVKSYERNHLIINGHPELAGQVGKVKDGNGYDIISFDEAGNIKYIEVKTTTGNKNEPFPISITETMFSRLHPENYYLYRVFNMKPTTRVAEFHEFRGCLDNFFILEARQFYAHRKQLI